MGYPNQVEAVKKALDLEVYIENTSERLFELRTSGFQNVPAPPVRQIIQRTYPEPQSKIKFRWGIAIFISLFFLPAGFIYHSLTQKAQAKDIEKIRRSAKYREQCARLDVQYNLQQQEADRRFQIEKQIYDTKTLPEYQAARNRWTMDRNRQINQTERDLSVARDNLNRLYQTTRIVPIQYRTVEALTYIYDTISTSNYDVVQAIELYDRREQRRLDSARLREQQRANALADEQSALLDEQNILLDRQNAIANQARHEARQAAIVAAVQRHNTNKLLKERNEKLR